MARRRSSRPLARVSTCKPTWRPWRQGLLVWIDHPINKDTELHPLVRCQYLGGIAENKRQAFLFTHVVDSAGRRYDIPVVVGA
jgi:hypothetical protein